MTTHPTPSTLAREAYPEAKPWCPSCAGVGKSTASPSGPCQTCKGHPDAPRAAYSAGIAAERARVAAWLREQAAHAVKLHGDAAESYASVLEAAATDLEGKPGGAT